MTGAETLCTGTTSGWSGTYTLSGGLNSAGSLVFGTGNPYETGTGTYNLNGGTLAVASMTPNTAAEGSPPVWKFNLGGGTLQATGNLTIGSSSFFTMALTANGSTIDTQGNTVTISTPISGAYSLAKNGVGTLNLTNTTSFSSLAINNGAVNVSSSYGLGGATGGITVAGVAALQLSGISGAMSSAAPLTLNGTGISNGGALEMTSGTTTWSGPIMLASAARINSDSGTLTLSGNIGGAYGLSIGGAGNTTISGVLGNVGSLTKDGAGTLTLNSNTTFSGVTTLAQGILYLNNNSNPFPLPSTLNITGGSVTFNNGNQYNFGGLAGSGNLVLTTAGNAYGVLLKVNGSGSSTYSGALSDSNTSSFNAVLNQCGIGSLTLSGQSTITGGVYSAPRGSLSGGNMGGAVVLTSGALVAGASSTGLPRAA